MDVVVWLRSLGLGKYEAAFRSLMTPGSAGPRRCVASAWRSMWGWIGKTTPAEPREACASSAIAPEARFQA
jgi:hypothetical protein